MELLKPENLIFLLPLVAVLGFVLLMITGLWVVEGGAEIGGAEAAADGVEHPGVSPLEFLGVGEVPLSILAVSLGSLWGSVGLASGLIPGWSLTARLAVAGVAAVLGTRLLAGGIARLLPTVESYSTSEEELVGEEADVVHEVTPEGGTVRVVDRSSSLRDLPCVVRDGQGQIARGARVLLSSYDQKLGRFIVERVEGKGE